MIASEETSSVNRENLILHYFQEFTKTLKNIGFMQKLPGLLELNMELLKNGFLEVIIAVCFMPFVMANEHIDDFEVIYQNGIEGVAARKRLYQNPKYQTFISKLLPNFLYKGMLE